MNLILMGRGSNVKIPINLVLMHRDSVSQSVSTYESIDNDFHVSGTPV